mmetsp:Transcript_27447/g.69810  ORF Transcript_27447/g.69810 Transcript_27447/m.69810 type:complete len:263 (+) Transcript_27447:333-1121(+)
MGVVGKVVRSVATARCALTLLGRHTAIMRGCTTPAAFSTAAREPSPYTTLYPALRAACTRAGSRSNAMYLREVVSGTDAMGASSSAASIWPWGPNPQMTTWSFSSWCASSPSFMAADPPAPMAPVGRAVLNTSSLQSATTLPVSASTGVTAMDSTTTMISTWLRFSGRILSELASESSTNANSPPWDSMKPVRSDSLRDSPNAGPSAEMTLVLTTSSPASINPMTSQLLRSTSMLMDEPVVTKNRPSSSPLNGRMSASTCAL